MDRFDGVEYRRVFSPCGKAIEISVVQVGSTNIPSLEVRISGEDVGPLEERQVRKELGLLLGLEIDLSNFYKAASSQNGKLGQLAEKFRGVKPPRFPSIFETLINAISCQQVSLTVGLLLMGRLASKFGPSKGGWHALPKPHDLSRCESGELRKIGYSINKSDYIIALAKSIALGQLNLERVTRLKDEEALDFLDSIQGVGRWSAQYVLLRGLGRLHRFPADDIGAQNGLKRLLGLRERPDYGKTMKILEPFQPYAGMVYFHLLLNRLEEEGTLSLVD